MDPQNLTLNEALKKEKVRINDKSLLPDLHFIHNTKYFNQVKYYKDHFNDVKVLLYDELIKDSQKVLDEITDFLNVERFSPKNSSKVYNASEPVLF